MTSSAQTAGPTALEGRDGYLFLAGDSNDSPGQASGIVRLSPSTELAWQVHLARLRRWERRYGFAALFLVAPSKEEVLHEHYPLPRAGASVARTLVDRLDDERVVFPDRALRAVRNFAFDRTDTHWTDVGAMVAARALLERWHLPADGLPSRFELVRYIGDLGSKATPYLEDASPRYAEDYDRRIVLNNGIRNNGNVIVYEEPSAPVDARCLIFGDSFGYNLAPALSCVFRRVTYLYKPGGFDARLAEIERPTHVVCQIAQRFLVEAPRGEKGFAEVAAEKVAEQPAERREAIAHHLRERARGGSCDGVARALLAAL